MFFIIYALICVQQVIIIPIKKIKNKKVVIVVFYYYKILDNILDSSLLCLQISFLYYDKILNDNIFDFFFHILLWGKKFQ